MEGGRCGGPELTVTMVKVGQLTVTVIKFSVITLEHDDEQQLNSKVINDGGSPGFL